MENRGKVVSHQPEDIPKGTATYSLKYSSQGKRKGTGNFFLRTSTPFLSSSASPINRIEHYPPVSNCQGSLYLEMYAKEGGSFGDAANSMVVGLGQPRRVDGFSRGAMAGYRGVSASKVSSTGVIWNLPGGDERVASAADEVPYHE